VRCRVGKTASWKRSEEHAEAADDGDRERDDRAELEHEVTLSFAASPLSSADSFARARSRYFPRDSSSRSRS
jgi:hypothetical protein